MHRFSLLLPLCLGLLLPGLAQADPAEALLQEGLVNYRVGKFDAALKVLDRAVRKGKDVSVLGQVHLYRGMILGVMGKEAKARAAFTAALKSNPTVEPKAGEAKSKVLALFKTTRLQLKGRLKVAADRKEAQVSVDGKVLGPAPWDGELPVGTHKVAVSSLDRMFVQASELVIKAGGTTTFTAKLAFVGSRLTITSRPAGARLLVDGKEQGITPLKGHALRPGDHKVELVLAGYQPSARNVTTRKGESLTLDLELKASEAAVAATPTEPSPAEPPMEQGDGFRWPIYSSIAAGVALAALGAGIGLGVASNSAYDEYQETTDPERWQELRDQIPGLELGSNVSFGVAGAAAAAAVILYFFVDRPAARAESEHSARILWGPMGASLSLPF